MPELTIQEAVQRATEILKELYPDPELRNFRELRTGEVPRIPSSR
jgi:hypothetical protein